MDLRLRKYVLYRVREKNASESTLRKLKQMREELRQRVIDKSGGQMDGQPRGQGQTSDVTQKKALQLVDLDRRIETLEKELRAIKTVEDKIKGMNEKAKDIYEETIRRDCIDLTAKAELLHMGRKQLINGRAALLKMFAIELGEYIDINELDK